MAASKLRLKINEKAGGLGTISNEMRFKVNSISLDEIRMSPNQPRKKLKGNDSAIVELANSIKERGLLQPIVVKILRPREYQIIAGERRYRAIKLLEKEFIECIVRQDADPHIDAILENLQRQDLTYYELGSAYRELVRSGYDQGEIARMLGKTKSHISEAIKISKIPGAEGLSRNAARELAVKLLEEKSRFATANSKSKSGGKSKKRTNFNYINLGKQILKSDLKYQLKENVISITIENQKNLEELKKVLGDK